MEIPADIEFLKSTGLYQLRLPEPVTTVLKLTEADGHALFIVHENKMQLEWLAQKIADEYGKVKNSFMISKMRLKRKRKLAISILILASLIALFRIPVSGLVHIDVLYLNVFVFTLGIVCCLQLLKYYALGISKSDDDLLSGLPFSELKELILKDYSPEG